MITDRLPTRWLVSAEFDRRSVQSELTNAKPVEGSTRLVLEGSLDIILLFIWLASSKPGTFFFGDVSYLKIA